MDTANQPPPLEFKLRVQPGDAPQPGRYTLTGPSPGEPQTAYAFDDAQALMQYLEWVALGSPRVH